MFVLPIFKGPNAFETILVQCQIPCVLLTGLEEYKRRAGCTKSPPWRGVLCWRQGRGLVALGPRPRSVSRREPEHERAPSRRLPSLHGLSCHARLVAPMHGPSFQPPPLPPACRQGPGATPFMTMTHYRELQSSHGLVLVRGDIIDPNALSMFEVGPATWRERGWDDGAGAARL